jgi:CRP-like cAMP-binding protein
LDLIYKFLDSSPEFINALIKYMQRITLQHGDDVITQGQAGSEMYFLRLGKLDVFVNKQFVNKLEPGCGFGEVSMALGGSRTSTVRSVGISELSVLTRASLETLRAAFPSDVVNVQQYAKDKLAQMKVLNHMTFLMSNDDLKKKFLMASDELDIIKRFVQHWRFKRIGKHKKKAAEAAKGATSMVVTVKGAPRASEGGFDELKALNNKFELLQQHMIISGEESRQGFAKVEGKVAGLESKLDAILAALNEPSNLPRRW